MFKHRPNFGSMWLFLLKSEIHGKWFWKGLDVSPCHPKVQTHTDTALSTFALAAVPQECPELSHGRSSLHWKKIVWGK